MSTAGNAIAATSDVTTRPGTVASRAWTPGTSVAVVRDSQAEAARTAAGPLDLTSSAWKFAWRSVRSWAQNALRGAGR